MIDGNKVTKPDALRRQPIMSSIELQNGQRGAVLRGSESLSAESAYVTDLCTFLERSQITLFPWQRVVANFLSKTSRLYATVATTGRDRLSQ